MWKNSRTNRAGEKATTGAWSYAARRHQSPVPESQGKETAVLPDQLHPPDEKPVGVSQAGESCRRPTRDGKLQAVSETHGSLGGSRLETLSTQDFTGQTFRAIITARTRYSQVDTKRDKKFIDSLALNTNNILYATVDAELPSGVLMIQTAELRKWWQGYMVVKINVLSQDSEQISTVEVQLPERASIVYYIATKRPISGGYVSPRNITQRELVP